MKILCLGALNIDHVYKVDHFVRAGETISSANLNHFCGGKGLNQSIALARSGSEVYHAGKIGMDGGMLVAKLRECGVNTNLVRIERDIPTGHAVIQVAPNGQNCIISFGGANQTIDDEYIDEILTHFGAGDVLMLQNEINNNLYAIKKAHKIGMKVAMNPSPISNDLIKSGEMALIDWFILNEVEGLEITGNEDPQGITRTLKKKYPNCAVMLTLGKNGCVYYDGKIEATHGIYRVNVVNTTAAGDTFAGFFLSLASIGTPIEETLTLASKASSLAVSRAGAADSIPSLDEVKSTKLDPF